MHRSRFRRSRCNACKNCLKENCGVCTHCRDKAKFGGPNILKQCCMNKRCLNPNPVPAASFFPQNKQPPKPKLLPKSKLPESYVLLRNICDERVLSRFRNTSLKNETSLENTTSESLGDSATDQKLWRSQRKRKANVLYMKSDEYVPTLKSRKRESVIKEDLLEGVDIDKLMEYLELQNETDRESLFVKKQSRCEIFSKTRYSRPQTAKTKRKKLRPFEHLRSSSVVMSELCLSPPLLTPHDSEIGSLKNTHDHGPPVLEPCKNEKETFRVSFSGRYCKINDPYSQEFYTDFTKIPNVRYKPLQKKKQREQDKQSESELDKTHKVREIGDMKESTSCALKSTGQLKRVDSKAVKKDVMATSLDKMMEKAEIDTQNSKPENRIPVYQNQIMETVKELAKEKKFVKFFQLNVGDKLIFIPTDGTTVIPKAYVMNKTPEATNVSKATHTKSQLTGQGTIPLTEHNTTTQSSNRADLSLVTEEPSENGDDGSLPKITSVFSLSSNADKDSTDNEIPADLQLNSASNIKVQIDNTNKTTELPFENTASRKLKSLLNLDMTKQTKITKQTPETDTKQLQSLLKHTVSTIFDNRHTAMNNSISLKGETREMPNAKGAADSLKILIDKSGIHYYKTVDTPTDGSSFEQNSAALKKMVLPNFGKLEPLEKVTSKALNETVTLSNMPLLVQKQTPPQAPPPKAVLQDLPLKHVLEDPPPKHVLQDLPPKTVLQDPPLKPVLQDQLPESILVLQDPKPKHVLQDPPPNSRQVPQPIAPQVPQPKLILIPQSNSSNSSPRAAVFVTSTLANTRLQSLLSNSKVQFLNSKPKTFVKSAEVRVKKPATQMIDNTGFSTGEVSRSPAKPLFLFPNRSNLDYQAIPRSTTSQVVTNLQSLVAQSSQGFIPLSTPVSRTGVWSRPKVQKANVNSTCTVTSSVQKTVKSISQDTSTNKLLTSKTTAFEQIKTSENKSDKTQSISQDNKQHLGTSGQEWVRVKSEPGDKHEFEATILTEIKKERSDSETESETETTGKDDEVTPEGRTRRKKHRIEYTFMHVQAEETDTKERIRRLREKLREQQEECESLKKTLMNDDNETT
ncbi:uncharacterized protein LOC133186909 [Saccostrea echinata]|uniref:uncharacterized protein LOC133186909 n=1 Tax=Saccostrea echinata TaxID=191078 RepID=UPI002A82502D|nr:uncharacterized protein LOC133186909 [Saccostrea echinata]